MNRILTFALLSILGVASPLRVNAQENDLPDRRNPQFSSERLQRPPEEGNDAAEEPDFAFIAGGPYTQPKGSFQLIMAGQVGKRSVAQGASTLKRSEYGTLLRNEWGLTDRWELDLVAPGSGERDAVRGIPPQSIFALSDSLIGIRYRLFKEGSFPLTLTMGPQLILPTGSVALGTSVGKAGYAWDLSTAKDWGGPVFIFSSFNYSFFPSVRSPVGISARRFNLYNYSFASALGYRALETGGGATPHHDVHGFVEFGLNRAESFDGIGGKSAEVNLVVAPGIRYGLMTHYRNGVEEHLLEVGISFPFGLNDRTPGRGVILQVQFEHILNRWATSE
ncbi:MAG: hypothetical protein ACM3NO_03660 [Deltaproteobacteria bacterium]